MGLVIKVGRTIALQCVVDEKDGRSGMKMKKTVFIYSALISLISGVTAAPLAMGDICSSKDHNFHIDKTIDEKGNFKFSYCGKLCDTITDNSYTREQLEQERTRLRAQAKNTVYGVGFLAGAGGTLLASSLFKAPGLFFPGILLTIPGGYFLVSGSDANSKLAILDIILDTQDKPGECTMLAYEMAEMRKDLASTLSTIDARAKQVIGTPLEPIKKPELIAKSEAVEDDKQEAKAPVEPKPQGFVAKIGTQLSKATGGAKMAK